MAQIANCTSHGLRKACATRLANAGVGVHGIMAVTGHKSVQQVIPYTEKFGRARAAHAAMARIESADINPLLNRGSQNDENDIG